MLKELQIRDFALIEELELSFHSGFNVLTGETGAGKSIIIDALGLLLGARARGETIRSGAEAAEVVGSFSVGPGIKALLQEWGLAPAQEVVISREIQRNGRNRCRVNGRLVSVAQLEELGALLVDIVGQHDSQSLLKPSGHLELLDSFGGGEHACLVREVQQLCEDWRKNQAEQRRLQQDERERNRRLDLLSYQIEEIRQARLEAGEEASLTAQRRKLANLDRLRNSVHYVYLTLAESVGQEEPVLQRLALAEAELNRASSLDPNLQPLAEAYSSACLHLEELNREFRDYLEQLPADSQLLAELELRLELIENLKRKYGETVQEILEYGQAAQQELTDLENSAVLFDQLEKEALDLGRRWLEKAQLLSEARKKLAGILERRIESELADLNMANTRFAVQFSQLPQDKPGPRGLEDVEFTIAPNVGEELKPLAKIASGGELSRVMLALKAILVGEEQIPTVIFDEIDAGLGGRTAVNLGKKLSSLSGFCQVFCVTHLPVIASYAHHHYSVQKIAERDKTTVQAGFLTPEERVQELVRMLGGTAEEEVTTEHARELLRRVDGS